MKLPLVSVIIPTHNRSILVVRCIRSVLSQNYKNIEVIVIDDWSTDNTKSVIAGIKNARVKYFRKKNGGPSSARNLGISKAHGKYITFCDDDDIYLAEKIKTQVKLLENNPDVGFYYSNGTVVDEGVEKKFFAKLTQRTLYQLLLESSQILTPTVMIRADVLRKIGFFDETIPLCEDYDLWLRVARSFRFEYVDKVLVRVYKHDQNLSNNAAEMFRYGVKVKKINLERCRGILPYSLVKNYEYMLALQQGKFNFFNNNLSKARSYLIKALLLKPSSLKSVIFLVFTFLGQDLFDKIFIPFYQIMIKRNYVKDWDV